VLELEPEGVVELELEPEVDEPDDPLEGVVVEPFVVLPLLGEAEGEVELGLLVLELPMSDWRQPAPPRQSPAATMAPAMVIFSFCAFMFFEGWFFIRSGAVPRWMTARSH
jgi:hypothetical protein